MTIRLGNPLSNMRGFITSHILIYEVHLLKFSWGASLYDWHNAHPDKLSRFEMAMEGVTQCESENNRPVK
jgi:hypothetical protein